jgi:hypothetical protein
LMRTLKTKERLCYDTIDSDAILPQQRRPSGEKRAILAAVVVVTREAQEAVLGMQPARMCPDWSTSRKPIHLVGRCRRRRERQCPKT